MTDHSGISALLGVAIAQAVLISVTVMTLLSNRSIRRAQVTELISRAAGSLVERLEKEATDNQRVIQTQLAENQALLIENKALLDEVRKLKEALANVVSS